MELWIRSQDKEDLIKVDNLGLAYTGKYNFVDRIGDIAKKEYHVCQFQENSHTTLGKFASKERALEVLDEIEDIFLYNIQNASYEKADLFLKSKMLPIVFQMPKE